MRLGSDPEVFLTNSHGKFLSVIGRVGGSKWEPRQIDGMPKGFTLQEDNVALEFGIPPAATEDEFVNHIRSVLKRGLEELPGTRFSRLSCTVFPKDQMEHPLAYVFGCEPDYNAWTGQENDKPQPPHEWMRSAGGHVHVETDLDKRSVICAMDVALGLQSVSLDETGQERRSLYGKAGACRFKLYGVEYRTLSNFWIFRKPLIRWVWRNSKWALDFVKSGEKIGKFDGQRVQKAINQGDVKLAQKLASSFGVPEPCL